MKYSQNWILTLGIFVYSLAATAQSAELPRSEVNKLMTKIETSYTSGYCEKLFKDPVYSDLFKRHSSRAALEDVLVFAKGQDSVARDWIGNPNVFKVGRKVNEYFFNFLQYADRTDVRTIISSDVKDFQKDVPKWLFDINAKNDGQEALHDKVDGIILKLKLAKTPLAKQEFSDQIDEVYLGLTHCNIYQIVTDEGSIAAKQFQEYAKSVNSRAIHKNIKILQDLAN